jgi:RND family efflux transporter MFP subunit
VALAVLSLLTGCGQVAADQATAVQTETAALKEIETNVDIAGVLSPALTEDISVKLSGVVQEAGAVVGDAVNAGDTLIVIDTKELTAQLAQAEASLAAVQDQAAVAKSNLAAAQAGTSTAQQGLNATKSLVNDQSEKARLDVDAAQKALDAVITQNDVDRAKAQADIDTAQREFDRVEQLFMASLVAQVDLDKAQTALDTAQSQYSKIASSASAALLAAQTKLQAAESTYTQVSGSAADSQVVAAESNLTGAHSKVETAQAQYEAASTSAVAQAQAAVNVIKSQLENAVVKAPVTGVVINKNVNTGEFAQAGTPLYTIADISKLTLKGTIAQETIPYVKVGQSVDVIVDIFPDQVIAGKVESVGPMAVATGSYFPVEISIDNADRALFAGVSAHASVSTAKENAIVVPVGAVVENEGQTYLFVLENGLAVKRTVVTGLKNADAVEIMRGLSADETVIVANANNLFDQMPVTAAD